MVPLSEARMLLLEALGPQGWWPGETPDEVLVGCVLAQNTRWGRVVPVIERLRERGLLSPRAFLSLPESGLAELLKGCGTYRLKAAYLRNVGEYMVRSGWDGSPESVAHLPTRKTRDELLALRGVGPETADCILLYVMGRPVFVVDAYTTRILSRHGLCRPGERYHAVQALFHDQLTPDLECFRDFHGALVACGARFCRPRRPDCGSCPLRSWNGGPACAQSPEGRYSAPPRRGAGAVERGGLENR